MFEENQQQKTSGTPEAAPAATAPRAAAPSTIETRPRMPDSPLREEAIGGSAAEDIFATTEPAPGGPPRGQAPTTVPFEELEERSRLVSPKLMVIVIVALIILGIAGWVVYSFLLRPAAPPASTGQPTPSAPAAPTAPGAPEAVPAPTPTEPPPATDSDQDRLTDEEEAQLGTNPFSFDTDSDGLTDYEEAKVYRTNPLIQDTDGDGFLDGQEVQGGYDPNQGGGARLLDLNKFINQP